MGIFERIGCELSSHDWGEWHRVDACTKQMECKKCGKTLSEYNHSYEIFYLDSAPMHSAGKRCRKCGDTETWDDYS